MANFDTENTGTWFYFDEEDESQGGVCLRVLSAEESIRIEKLTTIKKDKFKAGNHYIETKTNDKVNSRLMWDYVITDWKNVCVNKEEVSCNIDNKVSLMNDPNFMNFVVKSLETLQENIESGKNLAKN